MATGQTSGSPLFYGLRHSKSTVDALIPISVFLLLLRREKLPISRTVSLSCYFGFSKALVIAPELLNCQLTPLL